MTALFAMKLALVMLLCFASGLAWAAQYIARDRGDRTARRYFAIGAVGFAFYATVLAVHLVWAYG